MENKTGYEELYENLISLGFSPISHITKKSFFISGSNKLLNTKYIIAQISDSVYFLAYDSYGTTAYSSSTFTGLYTSINLPIDAEYKVCIKDWFDCFLFSKRKKIGNKYIDNKISIISSQWIPITELSLENVNLFLDINKTLKPYSLIVRNNYISLIEQLKNSKVLGIETKQWIYDMQDLKHLLLYGSKLINNIVKNIS